MKFCYQCKQNKILNEWGKNSSTKDGLQYQCKSCTNLNSRIYYKNNKKKHLCLIKEGQNRRKQKIYKELKKLFELQPCLDCGESNPILLEFDHVRGVKKHNVSTLISGGWSWKTILTEINKCEIVCVKCHRLRTAKRNNWLWLNVVTESD